MLKINIFGKNFPASGVLQNGHFQGIFTILTINEVFCFLAGKIFPKILILSIPVWQNFPVYLIKGLNDAGWIFRCGFQIPKMTLHEFTFCGLRSLKPQIGVKKNSKLNTYPEGISSMPTIRIHIGVLSFNYYCLGWEFD